MQIIDINGEKRECSEITPDSNFPGYLKIKYKSRFRENHEYFEWYKKQDFLNNNPELSHLIQDSNDEWKEDLGVVSISSNITLTDKLKKWKSNEFAGYPIWISRGKGEGQTRKVTQNSDNTIIINQPWEINPDKTSQYLISHNVHNPVVMGNALPVGYKLPKKKKHNTIKKKK
jgi:hypothetical protein